MLEEVFVLSHGGTMTYREAKELPIELRRWWLQRLADEKRKREEREGK